MLWAEERAILAPPEGISVSEWTFRNRVVTNGPRPGPWAKDLTPFLDEIMDCHVDRDVREVTVVKGAQVGGTDTLLNIVGFVIDQEASWILYVMPRDEDWKHICTDRVKPMVQHCQALLRHMTDSPADMRQGSLRFDRTSVFFAAAGSPAGLASKPCRVVVLDEVDKYPSWTGKEADPVSLAKARTRTFANRKIYKNSTPTTTNGPIWLEYLKSDQRRFHIPCPHCGTFQHLVWSQVRFPADVRDPELLRVDSRVAYHCISCDAPINDQQKRSAMRRGVWAPKGSEITSSGQVVGVRKASHRGYHVTGLLSPFRSWAEFAAEWVSACKTASGLMDFYNSTLGEPFALSSDRTEESHLEQLRRPYAAGTVPEEAITLTAGADVQERLIYYTIRAWGIGMDSWLVRNGRVDSWEALENILFHTAYKRPNGREELRVRKLFIDAQGHHTTEVQAWSTRWDPIAAPIKGAERIKGEPLRPYRPTRDELGKPIGGTAWHLDTNFFKDLLHRLIHTQAGDRGTWCLHQETSQEYLSHITAEHRVVKPKRGGSVTEFVWVPRPGGRDRNHWLDCEVYALAAAELLGLQHLQEAPAPESVITPGAGIEARTPKAPRVFGGRTRHGGFGR